MANPSTYLVAGAGVAGIEAAAAIRDNDNDGRILVAGAEPHPFYARLRLCELVDGRLEVDRLVLRKEDWYRDHRIELMQGVRLDNIETGTATARLSDGTIVSFDRLLLATGSTPFVPPISGAELDGVCTLRTIDDALALRELASRESGSAVVVGGGLLGLEVSVALSNLGMSVTVVDVSPWLLSRQLDPEGGEVIRGILERRGLEFRTATTVESISGHGRVEGVDLAGGEHIPASLVLVAAGVRPNVRVAREAGIEIGRGIIVDDSLETSAPGVFAAGDCAEHRGRVYGIWPASQAQGRAAGAAMAGKDVRYEGTTPSNTLKIADVAVFSIGRVDVEARPDTDTVRDKDVYRRLFRDSEGCLNGAILINDLSERKAIANAVEAGTPYGHGGG